MIPAKEFEGELWIKASDHHQATQTAQRPLVGLTDEELTLCESEEDVRFVRAIEAVLRSKNT